MEERKARAEDLPPLELRELRKLDLDAPSTPEGHAHVAAASGVVRRAEFVYVVGDDELHLAVFDAASGDPGRLHRALSGELPADPEERKKHKPDLEAITTLPPFEGHPHGALLGLGSGSTPDRDRGFAWALGADGGLDREPVMRDELWLLQRGNTEQGANVVVALSCAEVIESLSRDRTLAAEELRRTLAFDLGELDDCPLTFSDASALA